MSKYLEIAVETALKAGKYLRERFKHPKHIEYKGEIDLVTDSDFGAEEIIINSLRKAYPQHRILAEETTGAYQISKQGYCWVIDPIDGTTNFAHGYPLFAISIALEYNGRIILGVAYSPLLDELFTAQLGKGAYLNGDKINVSKTKDLSQSLLATGFPYDIRRDSKTNLRYFSGFQLRAQDIRRDGSAVLNLCYTACGRFDGFWELKLKPWDTASGFLMVKEAGGKVSDFSGNRFNIYEKEIAASNGLIHRQMLETLKPVSHRLL